MNVGFIGVGNMGGAIASCIGKSDDVNLLLSNHNIEKAQRILDSCGGMMCSNDEIVRNSDVVFIGVKPQMIKDVFSSATIDDALKDNKKVIWISMAAGVKIEDLKAMINSEHVVRIMPNTPVLYGAGMTTVASDNQKDADIAVQLLEPAGQVVQVDESLLDISTAIAGCGPAFVYMFINALVNAGIENGLSKEVAKQLAAQTVAGSGVMVQKSQKDIDELVDNVCSPGGATIEGVKSLSNNNLNSIIKNAVEKSFKRSKELG